MPTFRWSGRGSDGRELEGEIEGASKHEALERVRAQGIRITSIAGGRDQPPGHPSFGAGEARTPDPRAQPTPAPATTLTDRLARERATGRRSRPRGLLIAAGFLGAGLAIGFFAPIVVCHCERSQTGRVDCMLSERDLAIFTIRGQTLDGVKSADSETRPYVERISITSKRSGTESRLVLRDDLGNSIRPTIWEQGDTLGADTSSMREAVDRFLSPSSGERMSMWQGHWVPLLFSAILMILGVFMLGLTILSLSRAATDQVYRTVGKLAASADAAAQRDRH